MKHFESILQRKILAALICCQLLLPVQLRGETSDGTGVLSVPLSPVKQTAMMVEQCRVNNTNLFSSITLETHLKSAASESFYFDLKPLPSQLRQQVQVNPDSIDWTQLGNPDFLLLNCEVSRDEGHYALTATLTSTNPESPVDVTIAAETPVSDRASEDAKNLMKAVWRRIDLPLDILVQGPDLSGLWYNIIDGRLLSIDHDRRVETMNISLPVNRLDSSPIYRRSAPKPEDAESMPELRWQRLHGSFNGGKLAVKDDILDVKLSGEYLEEGTDRLLDLKGTDRDGSAIKQRWQAIQPTLDDLGAWESSDGKLLKITKSSESPGRYTVRYLHATPPNAPWTKGEILLDGSTVLISFMKKSGNSFKLVERKTGTLVWSSLWHVMVEGGSEHQEIRFDDDDSWVFSYSA